MDRMDRMGPMDRMEVGRSVLIQLDKNEFDREIILKTSFCFSDKYFIFLDEDKIHWNIGLKPKKENVQESLNLEDLFREKADDELLRKIIINNTLQDRKKIFAKALFGKPVSNSYNQNRQKIQEEWLNNDFNIQENELDDYLSDPLGIAVPWEERKKVKKPDEEQK